MFDWWRGQKQYPKKANMNDSMLVLYLRVTFSRHKQLDAFSLQKMMFCATSVCVLLLLDISSLSSGLEAPPVVDEAGTPFGARTGAPLCLLNVNLHAVHAQSRDWHRPTAAMCARVSVRRLETAVYLCLRRSCDQRGAFAAAAAASRLAPFRTAGLHHPCSWHARAQAVRLSFWRSIYS